MGARVFTIAERPELGERLGELGWTGIAFPDTGDYVVPGALVPVQIDRERDEERYIEPNVWMRHSVGAA